VTGTIGLLETHGLTPAMVAIDAMSKAASIRVLQVELNDLCGVVVKIGGPTAAVQAAVAAGERAAAAWQGRPLATVLTQLDVAAGAAVHAAPEYNPLIEQPVVFEAAAPGDSPPGLGPGVSVSLHPMSSASPAALGFIETQGFTAVFEAIDTACKAAQVEVVGKEKLGGGYVTVIVEGDLSAVTAAIAAGQAKVEGLGKLIAAHVIARPSEPVLRLLPKL